ncbi:zinc ribbon domain-containing protein [Sporosarcina sp. 179-K 8C2 HS]|uniref:hypothetical protein n=1 Tax=Sporosarcina sp. 179-K 8C2 HS TaxID=3142387 RepID=UPI0039A0F9DB
MFCKDCGANNNEFDLYCAADGAALLPIPKGFFASPLVYCGKCGGKSDAADAYCKQCGHHLIVFEQSAQKVDVSSVKSSVPIVKQPALRVDSLLSPAFIKAALVPAAIAIILALLSAFVVQMFTEKVVLDAVESSTGISYSAKDLQRMNMMAQNLLEEKVNVSGPKVYGITTFVALLHNADIALKANLDLFLTTFGIKADLKNLAPYLLFIPSLILALGGVLLGKRAWKSGLPILPSAIWMSVIYAFFVAITTLFAGWKISGSGKGWAALVAGEASLKFSIVTSFITALLLALVIVSVTAFFTKHGKMAFTVMKTMNPIYQYGFYSLLVVGTIAGIGSLLSFWTLVTYKAGDLQLNGVEAAGESLFIALGPFWLITLSHLVPLNFKLQMEDMMLSVNAYLFSSTDGIAKAFPDNPDAMEFMKIFLFRGDDGLPIWMKLSIFIPIILLGVVGFKVFHSPVEQLASIVLFAATYTVLLVLFTVATRMGISITVVEPFSIKVQAPIIGTAAITFVLAFVCLFVGGFVGGKKRSVV